jgi:hypothetical protein
MKRKLYLMVALLAALVVTGSSFAYTQTSDSVSTSVSAGSFATVDGWDSTDTWGKYDTLPSWTPVEGTAGSVEAGDLYYITNPSGYTGNLLIMLYVTNVGDLADCYSYLNMQVQAYDYDSSANSYTSKSLDLYLTLSNGYVSFILPQASGDGYVITIDGGSWYCFDADGGSLSPSFYIDVRQA